MPSIENFVNTALDVGPTYRFGGGCSCRSATCNGGDCSELVKWAACRNGVTVPDGSWIQYRTFRAAGLATTPERAINTRGGILFIFSSNPLVGGRPTRAHVAISLGNGSQTVECRSTAAGCGVFGGVSRRGWTHAALIPGFDYSGTASASEGGAGPGPEGTTPSTDWVPPTVGPPPSPPPPPPPPATTAPVITITAEIENIIGSRTCGRSTDAKLVQNPHPEVDWVDTWITNGILKAKVTGQNVAGVAQRNIGRTTISVEEFDALIDVSGW